MFLLDGVVVTSASDLSSASKCEFAFARQLDSMFSRLWLADGVTIELDPFLVRTRKRGMSTRFTALL